MINNTFGGAGGAVLLAIPICYAGAFLAAAFGFDAVTVTAFIVACTVGSSIMQKLLMSREARVVWGITNWPLGLQCIAILVLALLFYLLFGRALYVPPQSDHGLFIRYVAMVILAWPVVVIWHIALDTEESIYRRPYEVILTAAKEAEAERAGYSAAPPSALPTPQYDFSFDPDRFKR